MTGLLRPLPGRLYSVASSLKAHPGEAHLLVGAVRWESHGRVRKGVSSTFLGERRKVGQTARSTLSRTGTIVCRPTGTRRSSWSAREPVSRPIAPSSRNRVADGAKGKSWLFFGERNFTNDFLYQLEWQEYLESGDLTRIDVAFSRDQPEKIYVQHRLWERRADINAWLQDGRAFSMSAAMRRAWRRTSIRCSPRFSPNR